MTVSDPAVVDAIGIDRTNGSVVLTVADDLGWEDVPAHLAALRVKLVAYVEYVEGGELAQKYPATHGREVRIDVVFRARPPEDGRRFLEVVDATLRDAGMEFAWRTLPPA